MRGMDVYPLDASSDVAPSEQLRVQIASRVSSGDLPAGTRLPTVRALAETLHLAANTVAKAYRTLEGDGVVVTEGRRGTFVASRPATVAVQDAAASYVAAARRQGLTLPEAVNLVQRSW